MRGVAIDTIAAASGVSPEEIPVLNLFDSEVDGQPAETMVYSASLDGLPVIYANTLILTETETTQATVFFVGTSFTDANRERHAEFLSLITLTE